MEQRRYQEPIPEQPELVLLGKAEQVILPDVKNHPSLGQIMDPERTAYRSSFEAAVKKKYSSLPFHLPEQALYIAGTGREFLALFPGDTSELRVTNVQQKVIREIAEGDNRFNRYHPDYKDEDRLQLHNNIARKYPDLREVFDEAHLSLPVKDAVKKMLRIEYPYFNDLVAAVRASGAVNGETMGSLELLYTENRISQMLGQLSDVTNRIVPTVEPDVFQKEVMKNLASHIDSSGNIHEGKIGKALRQYDELAAFSLPSTDIITDLQSNVTTSEPAPQSGEVFRAS